MYEEALSLSADSGGAGGCLTMSTQIACWGSSFGLPVCNLFINYMASSGQKYDASSRSDEKPRLRVFHFPMVKEICKVKHCPALSSRQK